MLVNFTKMHSLGEGFMLVDQISQKVRMRPEQARRLADSNLGVGFGQLLLLEPPTNPDADFSCIAFNPDGQEAVPSSNGLRCLAALALDKKLTYSRQFTIETLAQTLHVEAPQLNQITLKMQPPPSASYQVTQVEDVLNLDLKQAGRDKIHNKAQACFVQVLAENQIRIRVYSATGIEVPASSHSALAAVVQGQTQGWLQPDVEVFLAGGILHLSCQGAQRPFAVTGHAHKVFEGQLVL